MSYLHRISLVVLMSICCWISISAQKKMQLVPTFENCSYYCDSVFDVAFDKAWNTSATFRLLYKAKDELQWKEVFAPYYDTQRFQLRGSIMNLEENTEYEIRLEKMRKNKWTTIKKDKFVTWSSCPPVKEMLKLSEMKEFKAGTGVVLKGIKGRANGWIKIIGDVAVEAPSTCRQALEIDDCKYLILENFVVKGGRIDAVAIRENCEDVRIIGADISAWGRIAVDQVHLEDSINYPASKYKRDNACFIDDEGVVIRNDAGIYLGTVGKVPGPKNIVIERCYIHDPKGHSNAWHGVREVGRAKGIPYSFWHPQGPQGIYMRSRGGLVIRYNDVVGADHYRLHDLLGGFNNGKIDGGMNVDADVYGNYLAFSQDDGLEMDGGQCNVRLYNNRIEQARVGISTAPNKRGPSYLIRNVIFNLGDSNREYSYGIKNGGGTMHSHGLHYFINNTFHISGNCISSVGYGSDVDRGMFQGYSRNNIFFNRKENNPKARGCGIYESHSHTNNHFDYDLFFDANKKDKKGEARLKSMDCERNAVYGDPLFVSPETGVFTLLPESPAIGKGQMQMNISENKGKDVDLGALSYGASSLIPQRPIDVQADKYLLTMLCQDTGEINIKVGNLPTGMSYTLTKNKDMDWFTFDVAQQGKVVSNSSFTISFNTKAEEGKSYRGVFFVRFSNGFSIPVSVNIL